MKLKRRDYFLAALCLLSLIVTLMLWAYPSQLEKKQVFYLRPLAKIPLLKTAPANEALFDELKLSATSAYALDIGSGSLLYQKNAETALYPASTVKMMTALVAVENYDLDEVLTVASGAATIGNQADLQYGEQLPVRDLLAALLVFSANDAAYVLANHFPAGHEAFIESMNQKAQSLHLEQSYFINPAGLDVENQVSSARDLSIVARELLKNPFLKNTVAQRQVKIESLNRTASGDPIWQHHLYSSNQLLGKLEGVKGVKTGTTELAGQVLVTLIERQGQEILIALMHSEDRYSDTEKLIAWIFNNYEFIDLSQAWQLSSF